MEKNEKGRQQKMKSGWSGRLFIPIFTFTFVLKEGEFEKTESSLFWKTSYIGRLDKLVGCWSWEICWQRQRGRILESSKHSREFCRHC